MSSESFFVGQVTSLTGVIGATSLAVGHWPGFLSATGLALITQAGGSGVAAWKALPEALTPAGSARICFLDRGAASG